MLDSWFKFLIPPRGIPSPAEFLEISCRLDDLPSWIGIGPRFTTVIPWPELDGGCGKTKFDGGWTILWNSKTAARCDSGAKASAVHLQEGTAYVKFAGAKGDEFTLTFAHKKAFLLKEEMILRPRSAVA